MTHLPLTATLLLTAYGALKVLAYVGGLLAQEQTDYGINEEVGY